MRELAVEQAQFYASAVRGRPQVRSEIGRTAELQYRGHHYLPKVFRLGPGEYRVEVNGARINAQVERLDLFECRLKVFGRRFRIVSVVEGSSYQIEVDGVSHRIDRGDGGVVHAPAPAVLVSILVKPGDTVAMGDRLAVLEAMKMEMEVVAPFSGRVRQVMAIPNVQVDTGAPLLQIDPASSDDSNVAIDRVVFGASSASTGKTESAESHCRQSLDELRKLMLGFDVDPKQTAQQVAEWSHICPVQSDEITKKEDQILNIFVDICSLFRREPNVNHRTGGEEPSAESYLFSYLRMLETRGEKVPPAFVERTAPRIGSLRRAIPRPLARTGIESALDLQISSPHGAANRAGSGSSRTTSATSREATLAGRRFSSNSARQNDLLDQWVFPCPYRLRPGVALSPL